MPASACAPRGLRQYRTVTRPGCSEGVPSEPSRADEVAGDRAASVAHDGVRDRARFLRRVLFVGEPWPRARRQSVPPGRWYDESMTVSKVSVSLDTAVTERARADVADGRAASVSAWINEAARARMGREELGAVLADLLDEAGGPLTDQERATARQRLADAEPR